MPIRNLSSLMQFLGLKTEGRSPSMLVGAVSPIIDLQAYLELEKTEWLNFATVAAAGATTYTLATVPQNEFWMLKACSCEFSALAVNNNWAAPAIQEPGLETIRLVDSLQTANALTGIFGTVSWSGSLILRPGDKLAAMMGIADNGASLDTNFMIVRVPSG